MINKSDSPLRGRPILLSLVWLQTKLDSTQSITFTYEKKSFEYDDRKLEKKNLRNFCKN